jgi:integrase/recombinase XerD
MFQQTFIYKKTEHFMPKLYISRYGKHIEQFVELKQKLGYKFTTGAVILGMFDSMAADCQEATPGITKFLANRWGEKRPNESDRFHYDRVRYLLGFSSFLSDLGITSYKPRLPPSPKNTFIPYIFSRQEIDAIFEASNHLRAQVVVMGTSIFIIPALIRVLYSTGIRISEALALTDDDVNLEESFILIRDSKNGKERIIPISESLVEVCRDYIYYRDNLPLGRRPEKFFINIKGSSCTYCSVHAWFKKCLEAAEIPFLGRHKGPRIHDLRHTFAVNALANMAESGMDPYVSLPILSNYLGHQSLRGTEHYVRLTSSMFPTLISNVDQLCLDVFPRLPYYEAY